MYSRRDLGKIALAAFPSMAAGKPNSKVGGVQLGAQSNSFSDRGLDAAIQTIADIGLNLCELWQGHVEPRQEVRSEARASLRKWRDETPAAYFQQIAGKFRRAGIQLFAYDYSFLPDFEDNEIDRGF
jgi:sugar phosphate isomerase/epimerase